MTEKESKSFQIKTLLLAAGITIISNLAFSAFGYYREDTKEFDKKLEKKVNVVDYDEYRLMMEDRMSENEEKWVKLITISTENQTDIRWLRETEEKKRNR